MIQKKVFQLANIQKKESLIEIFPCENHGKRGIWGGLKCFHIFQTAENDLFSQKKYFFLVIFNELLFLFLIHSMRRF